MSKKLDWTKPFAKTHVADLPSTKFNEVSRKRKPKVADLNAKGVPDIKTMRAKVDKAMRKYRLG